MNVLGIIPARGGSKGIPHKNLALVAGKPLLAYTADSVKGARSLSRTILSTDDTTIADAGKKLGLEVPFLRPVALAGDDTPMIDVIRHALTELSSDGEPDAVVLLQPTSPLRVAKDIDDAVALLTSTGADAVVSVVEVPHHYAPDSLMRMEGDRLHSLVDNPALSRQDKQRVFARNGPAVLVLRTAFLKKAASFYAGDTRALIMPRERSIDIDDPFDLTVASLLLSQGGAKA